MEKSRTNFIKDMCCHIPTIESPYFEYFLSVYGLEDAYRDFLTFTKELSLVKPITSLYEPIKQRDSFKEFNTCDLNAKYPLSGSVSGDIYDRKNVGKYFLTVDLKEAAYQALLTHNPEIVFGCLTFSDYIDKTIKASSECLQYIKSCKHIRTVALGNLNPSRTQHVYRWITLNLEKKITPLLEGKATVFGLRNDEIIYQCGDSPIDDSIRREIETVCAPYRVSIENFRLEQVHPKYTYFSRTDVSTGKKKLKCIRPIHYIQVYKHIHVLPHDPRDLIFTHEGELCTMMKPIY